MYSRSPWSWSGYVVSRHRDRFVKKWLPQYCVSMIWAHLPSRRWRRRTTTPHHTSNFKFWQNSFFEKLKKMFFYIFVFFVFTLLLFSYKQILFWKNRPPGFIFTHFTHFWSTLFFTLSKCIVHFNAGRSRDRGMIVCRRTPGWVLIMI